MERPQNTERRKADDTDRGTKILGFFMREAGIGAALLILCVLFAAFVPQFASKINVSNILTQISINTAISVGMTFVILLGGIDLSVGSVISLCTIAGGMILSKGAAMGTTPAILLAVIASIAAGLACGLFNGWVSVKWNIHSFIVTLGMLNIARARRSRSREAGRSSPSRRPSTSSAAKRSSASRSSSSSPRSSWFWGMSSSRGPSSAA